jgi:hypothetical protein
MERKRNKATLNTATPPRVERRKMDRRHPRTERDAPLASHLSLLEPVYFPFEL